MKKALWAVLVFVVLCAIVGFWTLKDFDQKLRSEIITIVSEKTGRSLVIDGETKTQFSLSPSVTIKDIKLTNAAWAEEPYMLQIDNLSVEAELMPLFARQVKIKRFLLDGIRLNLEKNKEGKNNWSFLSEKDTPSVQSEAQPKNKEEVKKNSFSFVVNDLEMKNLSTVFINKQTDKMFNVALNTLNLQSSADNGVAILSQWSIQGQNFDVSAKADSFEALFEALKPYRFAAEVTNDNIKLSVDGTITEAFKTNQISASVQADVTDLSVLQPLTGYSLPAIKNVNFSAQVTGTPENLQFPLFQGKAGSANTIDIQFQGDNIQTAPLSGRVKLVVVAQDMGKVYGLPALPASVLSGTASFSEDEMVLDNLKMKIGKSDLSGRLLMNKESNFAVFADFHSALIDLSELLAVPLTGNIGVQKTQPVKKGTTNTAEKRVFSEKPLALGKLKVADIQIKAGIDKLIAADRTDLGKIGLTAIMQNGKFSLSNFKLANYVSANAVLDATGKTAIVNADIRINNMPLALFYAKQGIDRGTLTGSVRLSGRGISENAIASSLNGKIFLNVRDVHVNSFRLIELPAFLSFLSPADKTQPVTVSCGVVNVPVKNGVLSSNKKIGMESSLFDMQINGDINLGSEKVNVKLDVSPRSDGILESVFNSVSIGGTLSSPTLSVNAEKTFDRALSLGMAFFMGGKEAAKELVRQESLKNVCADALAADK